MPRLLHITDKPEGGGGIRIAIERQSALLAPLGWTCETVRYGDPMPEADMLHLHLGFTTLTTALLERLRGRPLVVTVHDVSPFAHDPALVRRFALPRPGPADRLRLRVQARRRQDIWRGIMRQACLVLCPSRFLTDLARAAGATRTRHLPHAVSPGPSGTGAGPFLYAGRISAEKGALLAMRAMERLITTGQAGDATLSLVGTGPALGEAKTLAQRVDPARFAFHGALPHAETLEHIRAARALLVPSLVPEGLGLSGLEALAHGVPVIGTGTGGQTDWLRHGVTGWHADPTPEAFCTAMMEALQDPAERTRRGTTGQSLVRTEFSEAIIGSRLDAHLRAAMAGVEAPA